ncbi:MAG: hypothetical protein LBS05_00935 [Tannerellaceae bacterium]|jgi:hypothetical protein|nr:hypothetical protein [Tannerellaceae bacterium]
MGDKEFNSELLSQLKALGPKRLVRFAGNCALRALPFTGINGNFDYWKEEERAANLYALFQAIEMNLNFIAGSSRVSAATNKSVGAAQARSISLVLRDSADAANLYAVTLAGREEATSQVDAVLRDNLASRAAAHAASFALLAAISACLAPYIGAGTPITAAIRAASFARNAAGTAFRAMSFARFENKVDAGNVSLHKFDNILLTDIDHLRRGISIAHTDRRIYGPIWQNFRAALCNEGCNYWGQLFEQLFADAFVSRPGSLRMNVPAEISARGAAVVAAWLRSREKDSDL